MASIATSILGGSFLSGLASLINSIRGKNPGDADKLQAMLEQYKEQSLQVDKELELARINAATQQDSTAGENIRAILQSSDPVVRRSIVMPMWICSLVVMYNYCLLPFVGIFHQVPSVSLPPMFWYLYVFSVGGSVGHGILDKALSGAGGSASFLGLKLDSKGD